MNPLFKEFQMSCPFPIRDYPVVTLAHGGGGILMHELIEKMFLKTFSPDAGHSGHDSAVFEIPAAKRLALTTDSYVVSPMFFPGGNIGTLAVYGTVNDLAMSGAQPVYLSVGFILEEGLPMEVLWQIVHAMQTAAQRTGVRIITGDTKVVDKGKGDGIFINTTGVGVVDEFLNIHSKAIQVGDTIIVNGDMGRHGIAIMAQREGLAFESAIESDVAPLSDLVQTILRAGRSIHCLRDLTRGGLASALNELAQASQKCFKIREQALPVREDVRGACELLGLDPLYVACEGRCVAFVPREEAEGTLKIMREHPAGEGAVILGEVTEDGPGLVTMQSLIGVTRIVDMISGEQLPRIC